MSPDGGIVELPDKTFVGRLIDCWAEGIPLFPPFPVAENAMNSGHSIGVKYRKLLHIYNFKVAMSKIILNRANI